ncbi:MAG: FAD-dependent oxidoreductase [Dehalococcoidia bacterium]|nr:FAD-dependent oxidoreductase [Dehalococcoidia bacterium]
MTTRVVVIGGNIEGVQAALDVANCRIEVSLIEQSPSLQQLHDEEESVLLRPKLLEAARHPNIRIFTGVDIEQTEGEKGSFRIKASQSPRYVKAEDCTSCGRCQLACPVNLSSPHERDIHKAIHRPDSGLKSVPSTCLVDKNGVPPCTAACPAGVNVQGYVALISKGKHKEALALIREAVPFPHILGRICTHPCETACTRGKIDQPIGIASLKRYLADMEPAQFAPLSSEAEPFLSTGRVAIIGAGPAGLTCARDLFRMGHMSTIFESLPMAGGMLAVGMPRFRLPREVREAEVKGITDLGIEIRTSTPIGKNLTITDLRHQGYDAIFLAIGCHVGLKVGIPGEDLEGVATGVTFLRALRLKSPVRMGHKLVVIGGGYTGIDVARAAVRMHCYKVHIIEKYTLNEVSATPAEVLETTEEGVKIQFLTSALRIIGENGRVVGVECQRFKVEGIVENGRPWLVPIEGSEFIIEADTVVVAIGQSPDLSFFKDVVDTDRGVIKVDPLTLSTNVPGIFAGGDAATGPKSVVDAVAGGRRAAVSIDRYLRGEDIRAGRTLARPTPVEVNLSQMDVPPGKRRRIPVLPIRKRVKNFEEVETGYTTFMAIREAERCLNCGGCSECMECVKACELEAIDHRLPARKIQFEAEAVVYATNGDGVVPDKPSEPGIYTLGNASKDGIIAERLTRASAIAGRVVTDLGNYGSIVNEAPGSMLAESPRTASQLSLPSEPRVGVFACRCGGSISESVDIPTLVAHFSGRSGVTYAHQIGYACSDEGALEIRNHARQNDLTHVVVAACPCCALDQICFSCSDRRMECKEKLLGPSSSDGLCYEFVNIREHCAWVHDDEPEIALEKAKALIRAGIARAQEGLPSANLVKEVKRSVVIIGSGLGGLQAASDLSQQGFQTTLIPGDFAKDAMMTETSASLLAELKRNSGRILEDGRAEDVQGSVGDFRILVERQGKLLSLNAGVVVIDLSAKGSMRLPEMLESAGNGSWSELDQAASRIPGIFLCGTDHATASLQGAAAASKASALLRKGHMQMVQTIATVDPLVCRGCGTCAAICEFGAPSLSEQSDGISVSQIDAALCRGCGTCAAHCPSNAITQNGFSDRQMACALEAMLTG